MEIHNMIILIHNKFNVGKERLGKELSLSVLVRFINEDTSKGETVSSCYRNKLGTKNNKQDMAISTNHWVWGPYHILQLFESR